ncbi:glyoxalase/bleomycin resistance protein/dioxygenase [Mycolicibacterium fortuitum]|uniref:Glyoxalase/bleomycin resistance protein/dioxygenase n=1 Tax=Mycolicibacterium fortuitum TaxID=1766 RepID=A0A378UDA9_MYCFO|nr:glyoxalase/bleomycin resistance protein/dioxygenase [Mycolicibacterium fortuitum]
MGGRHRPGGQAVGLPVLTAARAARLPRSAGSQQIHLDIQVDDPDAAQRQVLALGATRVTDAVGERLFRVFRDPAGHPFCLVWGID